MSTLAFMEDMPISQHTIDIANGPSKSALSMIPPDAAVAGLIHLPPA